MKPYEYFDHTADTLLRSYGKTFEEALSNLVLAVYNVIVDISTVQPVESRELAIESKSKETLVYDLITELLYHQDTESFLGCEVDHALVEKTPKGWKATLTILGDTKAEDYDVHGQIKSATYSEMLIIEKESLVTIQTVLDL